MNRESIREYAGRQRERYLKATRKEKGKILDEVVSVTAITGRLRCACPLVRNVLTEGSRQAGRWSMDWRWQLPPG
ncbi:MAG: hypothetical protein Q7K03_09910 [Dehalococcoidia bacterium]|nr:hypothetical protein [Dehalococcoidia bacterium]